MAAIIFLKFKPDLAFFSVYFLPPLCATIHTVAFDHGMLHKLISGEGGWGGMGMMPWM